MRSALHLAVSLIRIPHLAFSLFLFPLFVSLALVFVQLIVTGLLMKASSAESVASDLVSEAREERNPIRFILYGSSELRPPIRVCRWVAVADGPDGEVPPDDMCAPDRLDVAIRTPNPDIFDPSRYVELFNQQVDRLHLCRACKPDIVIHPDSAGSVHSELYSIYGAAVLSLPYTASDVREKKIDFLHNLNGIQRAFGDLHLYLPDVKDGIALTQLQSSLPFTLNVGSLILLALWLALRAHRRVLDYFSQNNVLLPLVVACGKGRFYLALWLLTLLRVGCFLCASIPLVIFGLKDIAGPKIFSSLEVSGLQVLAWLLALVSAFGLATIISSIADLKRRHNLLSLMYRFIPMLVALFGTAVWGGTFLVPSEAAGTVRLWISAVPVIGITPIFVAPIIKLPLMPMIVHLVLSGLLIRWALAHNARWFAAHLEEV